MSHYMTALAMQQRGLKPAAKIVLYWLADHHNSETSACFPSLNTLAKECEMDRSTVVRHLEALEAGGLIARDKRVRSNGSQTSTAYVLTMTPVAKCNSPCGKTQQPPVAKCDPLNLGSINHGSEQESTNVLLSDTPAPIDETAKAISAYNEVAAKHGWATVQKVTTARRAAIKGRLKDAGGIDGWAIALEKAEASPFLRGERGGFKCSFDFLSKQANFVKLMEGNYDERPSTNNGTSGGNSGQKFGNSIASAVARRRAEQ